MADKIEKIAYASPLTKNETKTKPTGTAFVACNAAVPMVSPTSNFTQLPDGCNGQIGIG